ncbi:MAG: thioredoxin [Actinobacteria bacterium]|nr:thioredoxin [Actinomycetota bacterium]
MSQHSKVLIIGSGPAGLTAAIYTARASLQPLVIEGEPSSTSDQPGGQLMLTTEVENFPGFPEGIMGPELMMRCREQAARFGAQFITEKVTKIDFSARPFQAWVRDQHYTADSVIVSTGAQSLMLGLPEEQRLIGHGLSTCATCDGFFFRNQEIIVVGGGDSALEEAQFLTKFASKVSIIVRRDTLRASKIMQERAHANPKISATLTSANFDETVRSADTPVLVDFWAEWCGPCKAIAPVLNELATEQAGKLQIGKLNVDDHGDIAMRFNVMSIPTLIVFKNGEAVKRLVGAKGKGQLLQELAEFLPASR